MGKIKLPDDLDKWEKKSLREDIGSEKEHTHTIYVYKNIAIEHEHECGCDAWNPYVLVDGHPFKLHSDYFRNFDEALGYIKGALKEKELLDEEPDEDDDDDDEPEEPEFPKAKVNDMSKSFVMPTAREMFAEAHALPDMYELAKSREMHKQQMKEFFDAQKSIASEEAQRKRKEEYDKHKTIRGSDADKPLRDKENPDTKPKGEDESKPITNARPLEEKMKADDPVVEAGKKLEGASGLVDRPADHPKTNFSTLATSNVNRLDTNTPNNIKVPDAKGVAPEGAGTLFRGTNSAGQNLYPANTNFDKSFFGKGGLQRAMDYYNSLGPQYKDLTPGYPQLPQGITGADLPISAIQELYANDFINNANAPTVPGGGPPQRLDPKWMGQINLLGLPDMTYAGDFITPEGNIDGRAWTLLQNGRKWDGVESNPIRRANGWMRLSDNNRNNMLRGNSMSYDEIGSRYADIMDDPVAVNNMFMNDLSFRQIVDLIRNGAFTPEQVNQFIGFTPYKAPTAQVGSDIGVIGDMSAGDRGSTDALGDKRASMAESRPFREIMEERIQKADAEAGIPSGFVGMHPHKAAYKTVWLGYGKDATYPFVLKNALTGEKVCEVSDIPRDERKD